MYRTGDLVRRRRHDRALEYLGRNDAQVKVRGVRVEPAEVEAALSSHGAVAFSVTVVCDDGHGSAELRSYVTLAENGSATESGASPVRLRPAAEAPAAFVGDDSGRGTVARFGEDRRSGTSCSFTAARVECGSTHLGIPNVTWHRHSRA